MASRSPLRAHLLRVATWGRRFRRGSRLAGDPNLGWSTVVVTDGDLAAADRLADELAELCWERRHEQRRCFPTASEAIASARAMHPRDVVDEWRARDRQRRGVELELVAGPEGPAGPGADQGDAFGTEQGVTPMTVIAS